MLSFGPFNPSFLAFWAFMCFHFGLLGLPFFHFCILGFHFLSFCFFSFPFILFFFHFLSFWFFGPFMCFYHGVLAIPLAIPLDTLLDTHECQKCTPSLDAHARLSLPIITWQFSSLFLHLCWWPWLSIWRGAPTVCVKENSFTDSREFTHAWAWKQHWCQDATLGNLNIYYVHTLSFM